MAKRGGMAKSTGYAVRFTFPQPFIDYLDSIGMDAWADGNLYEDFCDEANLPSSQAATGQITGRYLGEGSVSYPHTKMYTDMSLSWMADANMEPYKFIQAWWQFIFGEYDEKGNKYDDGEYYPQEIGSVPMLSIGGSKTHNRPTRLRFPEEYTAYLIIAKAERGPNSEIERVPTSHVIQDVYPYSVDSVPLSFGMDQLVKVTANFYYSKHTVKYNDLKYVQI